jgi:hypothetical protein
VLRLFGRIWLTDVCGKRREEERLFIGTKKDAAVLAP